MLENLVQRLFEGRVRRTVVRTIRHDAALTALLYNLRCDVLEGGDRWKRTFAFGRWSVVVLLGTTDPYLLSLVFRHDGVHAGTLSYDRDDQPLFVPPLHALPGDTAALLATTHAGLEAFLAHDQATRGGAMAA